MLRSAASCMNNARRRSGVPHETLAERLSPISSRSGQAGGATGQEHRRPPLVAGEPPPPPQSHPKVIARKMQLRPNPDRVGAGHVVGLGEGGEEARVHKLREDSADDLAVGAP